MRWLVLALLLSGCQEMTLLPSRPVEFVIPVFSISF